MSKKNILVLSALFLLVGWSSLALLISCRNDEPRRRPSGQDPKELPGMSAVILRVKDSTYANFDFEKHVRSIIGDGVEALSPETLSRIFDRFIEEKLLLQAAQEADITLSWEEKKEYLAKLRNESWTEGPVESLPETEAETIFDRLLIEKYIYQLVRDISVGESEISDYYERHKREFLQPERVKVSQILLETEDKAIEILEKLKDQSEEIFRRVASEESIGPEAFKGGEMGIFRPGQLPYEIEKVVFSLDEGAISHIVESSYGYHIFRLDKRFAPALISLEEASSGIRVKILDSKIKEAIVLHLEELKQEMDWSSYPQNLSFPYQGNIT